MNETQPPRNPETHQSHRREVFWQITFPIILGVAAILGLAAWVLVLATRGGNVSQAADTSLIFLILPTMLMALLPLVLLAVVAYGIIWLNKNLPPYAKQAQDAFARVRDVVRQGADKSVEPILRLKSALAALKALGPK
jgi:hypothetical protein